MLHVGKFYQNTIKLNDSYQVLATFPDNQTTPVELVNCVGFSIPKPYEWNEEVHKYGNMSQKFLIPKVDILPTLTIELLEYINDSNELAVRKLLSHGKRITYSKSYDISERYTAAYRPTQKDLSHLTIKILDNNLSKCVYAYDFSNLTITKADPYEFSYEDDSVCKWTITFIFESMDKNDSPTSEL